MSIEVKEIQRAFRYNGVTLPDVPGMTPREVRDLYSAQYPELISAEIEAGEVIDGVQEYTFRKAVGTKGGAGETDRLAALQAAIELESKGAAGVHGELARALVRRGAQELSRAWGDFVQEAQRDAHEAHAERVLPASNMLPPLL